eukprot:4425184-Ditylum_brightwellii.AAC.1
MKRRDDQSGGTDAGREVCTSTVQGFETHPEKQGLLRTVKAMHYNCCLDETIEFDISSSAAILEKGETGRLTKKEVTEENGLTDVENNWEMSSMQIELWSQSTGALPRVVSNVIQQPREDILLATAQLELKDLLELTLNEKELKWASSYHPLKSEHDADNDDNNEKGGFRIRLSLRVEESKTMQ